MSVVKALYLSKAAMKQRRVDYDEVVKWLAARGWTTAKKAAPGGIVQIRCPFDQRQGRIYPPSESNHYLGAYRCQSCGKSYRQLVERLNQISEMEMTSGVSEIAKT